METFKCILITVILIAFGAFLVFKGPESKKEDFVLNTAPEIVAKQLCYIWNTEAGDKAMLSMDIRESNVIGEFYFFQTSKKIKTGIFKGVVSQMNNQAMTQKINSIWQVKDEDKVVKEELQIIFEENGIASPGFGEMYDEGGIFLYTDPEKLSYPINLQQTDCGDEAMD